MLTGKLRRMGLIVVLGVFAVPVMAQDKAQTLADIRQDLTVLYVETQRLKRELSTSGTTDVQLSGGSALERAGSIEGELQRLTGKIEELEFRIDRIVKDATNRIGDLEFRLVELEGGDVSKLSTTTTLGGETGGSAVVSAAPVPSGGDAVASGTELAVGEQADFDAAKAALESGDTALAAESFATFLGNYPGSPLETEARVARGVALEQGGDTREAARSYLDAYSGDPSGARAPDALFLLGRALGKLGKTSEACVTLREVSVRHPGSAASGDAEREVQALSCE